MNGIGSKIREARKAANITQQQLADKSGIIVTTIRKYEIGKQNPKTQNLEKIAAALNISPSELMPNKKWQGLEAQEKEIREYFAFEKYVKEAGYHVGNPDADLIPFSKNERTAYFSGDEITELRNAVKDVIDTRFYKKLMEHESESYYEPDNYHGE